MVIRGKVDHYIMIKDSIDQKDTIVINIYIPSIGATRYIKQILRVLKGETDNTIMGDFNTLLLPVCR